jgi:3D (Asp-Asp-Asp) domain-containing protein
MITVDDECRSLIRMHVRGIPAHTLMGLLMSSRHGPWDEVQINLALARCRADDFAFVGADGRWCQSVKSIMQEADELALAIVLEQDRRPWWQECFGAYGWKLIALAALLLAMVGGCMSLAHGSEGRWITAEVTAYCPCALCCDVRTERTADGTNTNRRPYGIAASPDLPMGAAVWVPPGGGYLDRSQPTDRYFRIDDRGGALRSEWRRSGVTRLDLRYRQHADAVRFGRRFLMVWVVL